MANRTKHTPSSACSGHPFDPTLCVACERDALREALELIAATTSNCISQCRAENNASLLRVHSTVVSVQIAARSALAKGGV